MSALHTPIGRSREISPELALVDADLADHLRWQHGDPAVVGHSSSVQPGAQPCPLASFFSGEADDDEVRTAARRINELADVNPPRQPRSRVVRHAGVAVLWFEAVVIFVDIRLGVY